jgi:hypothetical protein
METKICKKCGVEKALGMFNKNVRQKHGRTSECKKCAVERANDYKARNPEKVKANAKRCRENKREYYIEKGRLHYKKNKEQYIKRAAEWAIKNPDKVKATREKNKPIKRQKERECRLLNKTKYNEARRIRYALLDANTKRERSRRNYLSRKEKHIESSKQYLRLNKDKVEKQKAIWRSRNMSKVKRWSAIAKKRDVDTLSNSYVRHLLAKTVGLGRIESMPLELIDSYRQHIKLQREIKTQNKNEKL